MEKNFQALRKILYFSLENLYWPTMPDMNILKHLCKTERMPELTEESQQASCTVEKNAYKSVLENSSENILKRVPGSLDLCGHKRHDDNMEENDKLNTDNCENIKPNSGATKIVKNNSKVKHISVHKMHCCYRCRSKRTCTCSSSTSSEDITDIAWAARKITVYNCKLTNILIGLPSRIISSHRKHSARPKYSKKKAKHSIRPTKHSLHTRHSSCAKYLSCTSRSVSSKHSFSTSYSSCVTHSSNVTYSSCERHSSREKRSSYVKHLCTTCYSSCVIHSLCTKHSSNAKHSAAAKHFSSVKYASGLARSCSATSSLSTKHSPCARYGPHIRRSLYEKYSTGAQHSTDAKYAKGGKHSTVNSSRTKHSKMYSSRAKHTAMNPSHPKHLAYPKTNKPDSIKLLTSEPILISSNTTQSTVNSPKKRSYEDIFLMIICGYHFCFLVVFAAYIMCKIIAFKLTTY